METTSPNNMNNKKPHYYSYLLRIWQVTNGDTVQWRASLEIPGSNRQIGFSDLEAVFDYLHDQITIENCDNTDSKRADIN